jgi:hypothetical protein
MARKHNVSEAGSVSVFRRGAEGTYSVGPIERVIGLALFKGPDRVCPLFLPEDGNRFSFRNFKFSSYLDSLTMRHPFYPQKLALTSPTSGCRSVGIVRSQTKATELVS